MKHNIVWRLFLLACATSPVVGASPPKLVLKETSSAAEGSTSFGQAPRRRLQDEPICGDSVISAPEDCDPPGTPNASGDMCDSTCRFDPPPICGNALIESGEGCDDGNIFDGDGCSATCAIEGRGTGQGLCSVTSDACVSNAGCPGYCSEDVGTTCPNGNSDCSGNDSQCENNQVCEMQGTPSPTKGPTQGPTKGPTDVPTIVPSKALSANPTSSPTMVPRLTDVQTNEPSKAPSANPTSSPTMVPTDQARNQATNIPTKAPSSNPTMEPTKQICLPPYNKDRDPAAEASETELLAAISALSGHIDSGTYDEIQINSDRERFDTNSARLTSSDAVMAAALDLIDKFESSSHGPLFMGDKDLTNGVSRSTTNFDGFSREKLHIIEETQTHDGLELERAMVAVQQAVLDEVYHGSLWHSHHSNDPVDRAYHPIVEACAAMLEGRKWLTSTYFPGAVDPPADPNVVHTVQVNAKFALQWGRWVKFSDTFDSGNFRAIRPLGGLYLSPGEIAVVRVPTALVDSGYTIQVGGNMIDNFNKGNHRRMDRITTTFPISSNATTIANPLGGGLYLRVPYLSPDGVEDVQIKVMGGVVKSPRFALTSLETTNEADWDTVRSEPGPWVDIESDAFLMTVPRIWVWDFAYSHMHTLLTNYTNWMEGITELVGVPMNRTNNYVGYLSADRHIRYTGYGVGYPQVNDIAPATKNGPQLSGHNGVDGAANYWMVVNPILGDTFFHELGHQIFGGQDKSMYRGEKESIVHVAYTYARNQIYGDNIDVAFSNSINTEYKCKRTDASPASQTGCQAYVLKPTGKRVPQMSVDDAAIDWMVRENFADGSGMNYSDTPSDEFRYQHRGHAKYADMARLFGWQMIREFYYQESEDAEAEDIEANAVCDLTSDADDRTFRLSLKAGADLTPLLSFWGIPPYDETALGSCMDEKKLLPSHNVKAQLEHYASIIPMNRTAFIEHFNKTWPGKYNRTHSPGLGCNDIRCGCGWYNEWYPKWDETLAAEAVSAVEAIISKHWGSRRMRGRASVQGPSRELGLFDPAGFNSGKAKLSAELNLWKQQSMKSYQFEMEYVFYAPAYLRGPFLVEVNRGVVTSVTEKESGNAVNTDEVEIFSIDGLFGRIESSFDDAKVKHTDVDYNKQSGVPFVFFKKQADDGDEETEEISVYVRDVVRL